jgi:hypothetical protein
VITLQQIMVRSMVSKLPFVDNDDLYIRRLTGSTLAEWRQIIHSGNIGAQSVNYATTAGFVTDPTKLP